jgi:hypothetical protein
MNGSFCGACGRAAGFAAPAQAQQPQYPQAQQPPYAQAQQPQYPPPPTTPSQYPPSQFPPPPQQPQGGYAQPPSPYGAAVGPGQQPPPYVPPPYAPAVAQTEWKWGYSRFIGITYGPIPVGIIVAVIVLLMIYK